MKKDKLGIKIAENPDQAFWTQLKEKCMRDIETHKREIIINEAIIELSEQKINEE